MTTPERPIEIDLEGIVNGEQAAKELNRTVAAQFYHVRTVTWDMTLPESLMIARGDVVGAADGIIGGGKGGRLLVISQNRRVLTLTRDVDSSGTIWIWDLNDNIVSRTFNRTAERKITLNSALSASPSAYEDDPSAYRFMTFVLEADVTKLRVVAKNPVGSDRMRFTARDEVSQYYDHRTSDLTWSPIPNRYCLSC